MRRGLTWLIGIVVVCVVVLVAADRITKYVFENKAADTLGSFSQFQTKPEVALNGFPFLTQALRGVYDDAEISSPAVIIESGTATIQGATLDAHLYGAHISLGDMLGGKVDKIPVDRVEGYVVVPYSEMERLSGIDGLQLTPQGDQLLVEAPVDVPILGSVKIQALGTFGIVDGGLKLNVSSLKVGGINLPTGVVNTVVAQFAKVIEIPPLPYGLHLTSTSTNAKGLQLNGEGTDVVLTQPPAS